MYSISGFRPTIGRLLLTVWSLFCALLVVESTTQAVAHAQEAAGQYTPASKLFPDSTAGLVRLPDLPKFLDAYEKTRFGKLMDDPAMQPFVEAQRERAESYFETINEKIGIRAEDLMDIATGEVVVAWLPFEKDKRRPFAVCVIADTRGARQRADKVMEQIDEDLKGAGATRTDVTHAGQEVRVYAHERKPGQLKIEQIAVTLSDNRIIAADRDSVVTDLLDAIAGNPKGKSISELPEFQTVLKRSAQAIAGPLKNGGGALATEWFARPFQMGRILRETFNVDRGNDVDILKLLEGQGFDAVKAAGGVAAIGGNKFDFLHRGFILAPAVTTEPSKYELAAKMLQFANTPREEVPAWVHESAASFNRLHLNITDAFWASETLIDEALGDKVFRPMLDGIKNDKDGPQIDIPGEVIPNLADQVILLTDNTAPVDENSERMLVAIRVLDAKKIEESIRKVMELESDTEKLDVVPGVEIWRVQRGESSDDDTFESEEFKDLDLDFGEESEDSQPLLTQFAIAVVDCEPTPYLVFSSHPELLIETAGRLKSGEDGGFAKSEEIKEIAAAAVQLGGNSPAFDRMVKMRRSLRAKYELLRQGKLEDSGSILAALIRRFFDDDSEEESEDISAEKLPPIGAIEKYLPNGGSYFETAEDGWSITGFLLK